VYRNDEFNIDEIANLTKYCYLPVLSSEEAGLLKDIIRKYGATKYTWRLLDSKQLGSLWRNTILKKVYHGIATMVKTVVDDELLSKV
jgi:anthranilate synthase component 2